MIYFKEFPKEVRPGDVLLVKEGDGLYSAYVVQDEMENHTHMCYAIYDCKFNLLIDEVSLYYYLSMENEFDSDAQPFSEELFSDCSDWCYLQDDINLPVVGRHAFRLSNEMELLQYMIEFDSIEGGVMCKNVNTGAIETFDRDTFVNEFAYNKFKVTKGRMEEVKQV